MSGLKIGLWIPTRKSLTPFSIEKPGMLLESVGRGIKKELEKNPKVESCKNLDLHNFRLINGKVYDGNFCASGLDAFFWFGEIERAEGSFHINMLKALQKDCVVINSPHSVELGLDKFKTALALLRHKIPAPKFGLFRKGDCEGIERFFSGKKAALIKPRFGCFGRGIIKCAGAGQAIDVFESGEGQTLYLEEFIEPDMEKWMGINVIGGKVAYAYQKPKEYHKDGWRIFDLAKKGGSMLLAKPDKKQVEIALSAARAFGLCLAGIDLVAGRKGGYFVVDVNTFPGLYPGMLSNARVNGPKMIADAILGEASRAVE